jgi:hypothetical protein
MFHISHPPCPKCGATTVLARIFPGHSGIHIRTSDCLECDIYRMVSDLADPMKAAKTSGWLQEELRAPL